ncbi:hypothetical protein [Kitasatospora sp. NPDC058478]|uniref:hypothetical protein n=1 Tax=unclassified Kitasatospora TaxID=2633591 RepID=UPI00364E0607
MPATAPFRGAGTPLFRCADTALLRAPVFPRNRIEETFADFPAEAADEPEQLSRQLARLGADPELRAAVALASPSLARLVDKVR